MGAYLQVHIDLCICIYTVYSYLHRCLHTSTNMYIHIFIYIFKRMYVYIYICICVQSGEEFHYFTICQSSLVISEEGSPFPQHFEPKVLIVGPHVEKLLELVFKKSTAKKLLIRLYRYRRRLYQAKTEGEFTEHLLLSYGGFSGLHCILTHVSIYICAS